MVKTPDAKQQVTAYTLSLLSANGSTVGNKSIKPNDTVTWDTAGYPAGVYLLTLSSADGIVRSTRVVKVNQ